MTVPPRISRTAGTPKCVLTSTSSSSSEGESSNAGDEDGAWCDPPDGRGREFLSKPLVEGEEESSKETPVGVAWDSLHPDIEAGAGEDCGSQGVEGLGSQADAASSSGSHEGAGSGLQAAAGSGFLGVDVSGLQGAEVSGVHSESS